jgi:hypothetical protein
VEGRKKPKEGVWCWTLGRGLRPRLPTRNRVSPSRPRIAARAYNVWLCGESSIRGTGCANVCTSGSVGGRGGRPPRPTRPAAPNQEAAADLPAARCAQSVPSAVIGFGVRHRTSARAVGETASVLSFDAPNGCAQLTKDTPTRVTSVKSGWGLDGQDRVVVDVVAHLQRSSSPPAVERNGKLRRFVQPQRVSGWPNCRRCCGHPRSLFVYFVGCLLTPFLAFAVSSSFRALS